MKRKKFKTAYIEFGCGRVSEQEVMESYWLYKSYKTVGKAIKDHIRLWDGEKPKSVYKFSFKIERVR